MVLKDVNQLLKPGYMPLETGYCRLPDGQMYVAVLTQMRGCKAKWVDWWFKNYAMNDKSCNEWDNSKHLSASKGKKNPVKPAGISPYGKYFMRGRLLNFRVNFDDPAQYFDASQLQSSGIGAVFCGRSFLPDGTPDGQAIHIVRDTDYGCEMRTRFWIYNGTEEKARERMEHCICDMNELAYFLNQVIEESQRLKNKNRYNVNCKFCHSHEVIKNGRRNGTQYWLCKNCGRGFVNNQALPKMKYATSTIDKAIHDHHVGRSLNNICRDIEKESSILPSDSTVLGWAKKLTKIALEEDKQIPYLGPRKASWQ